MICHLLHCFFLKRFFCERFICCPADGSTDVWHQDISLLCSCRRQHCGVRSLFYKGAYEIIEVWDGLGWPKKTDCVFMASLIPCCRFCWNVYIYIYKQNASCIQALRTQELPPLEQPLAPIDISPEIRQWHSIRGKEFVEM